MEILQLFRNVFLYSNRDMEEFEKPIIPFIILLTSKQDDTYEKMQLPILMVAISLEISMQFF